MRTNYTNFPEVSLLKSARRSQTGKTGLGSVPVCGNNRPMADPKLKRPPLSLAYWPGWIGVGFLWLLGKTPKSVGLLLSAPLGWLLPGLMKRRYKIAERNVLRCFPEKTEEQRQIIVNDCFRSLARTIFEMAWAWSASDRVIKKMSQIQGLHHLLDARKAGKGVLMVSAHITCLDMGARILGCHFQEMKGVYRPIKSPVLEWYQTRGRSAYSQGMYSKRDTRSAIRYLRSGGVLWYAPDQDFGPKQSVFAPFFGIQTATLLATRRMPQMTGCKVVMMFPSYDANTRSYTVEILPALKDFPGEDDVHDLTRINSFIEDHVRKHPEQYWWVHRRFKTRPEGEPPFYS